MSHHNHLRASSKLSEDGQNLLSKLDYCFHGNLIMIDLLIFLGRLVVVAPLCKPGFWELHSQANNFMGSGKEVPIKRCHFGIIIMVAPD